MCRPAWVPGQDTGPNDEEVERVILPKLALAILIGIVAFACPPSSADEAEQAEQAALCRGDVMRLRMGEIPDRTGSSRA